MQIRDRLTIVESAAMPGKVVVCNRNGAVRNRNTTKNARKGKLERATSASENKPTNLD